MTEGKREGIGEEERVEAKKKKKFFSAFLVHPVKIFQDSPKPAPMLEAK